MMSGANGGISCGDNGKELECAEKGLQQELIRNPFETKELLDNLARHTQFSPEMFTVAKSPVCPATGEQLFQWDIGERAILMPVEIDESTYQADLYNIVDEEYETKAQNAINQYFSKGEIVPSPWSEPLPPHVLPPTPVKEMHRDSLGFGLPYKSRTSTIEHTPPSGAIKSPKYFSPKDLNNSNCAKHSRSIEVATQTDVSLPLDFNLGAAMAFCAREAARFGFDGGFTTTRRQLFTAEQEKAASPNFRKEKLESSPPISPVCTPKCTSVTPASGHFSSSPIQKTTRILFRKGSTTNSPIHSPMISPIISGQFSSQSQGTTERNAFPHPDFAYSPLNLPPEFPHLSPISHTSASSHRDLCDSDLQPLQMLDSSQSLSAMGSSLKITQDTGYQTGYQQPDSSSQLGQTDDKDMLAGKRLFSNSSLLTNDEVFSRLHNMTSSGECTQETNFKVVQKEYEEMNNNCCWLPSRESLGFKLSQSDFSLMTDLGVSLLDSGPNQFSTVPNCTNDMEYVTKTSSSPKRADLCYKRLKTSEKILKSDFVRETINKAKEDLNSVFHNF